MQKTVPRCLVKAEANHAQLSAFGHSPNSFWLLAISRLLALEFAMWMQNISILKIHKLNDLFFVFYSVKKPVIVMNDVLASTLSKADNRRKPLRVIKRYLRLKYNILVSDEVLEQRMRFLGLNVA